MSGSHACVCCCECVICCEGKRVSIPDSSEGKWPSLCRGKRRHSRKKCVNRRLFHLLSCCSCCRSPAARMRLLWPLRVSFCLSSNKSLSTEDASSASTLRLSFSRLREEEQGTPFSRSFAVFACVVVPLFLRDKCCCCCRRCCSSFPSDFLASLVLLSSSADMIARVEVE